MFFIDIDGTIAGRNMTRFAQLCNKRFALHMTSERFENLKYKAFMDLPEVQAYRQQVGEQRFWRDIHWLELHPSMLTVAPVLPGAIASLEYLATFGDIAYYTARSCKLSPEMHTTMCNATLQWLSEHAFPNADRVEFCYGISAKLQRIAQYIKENHDQVVLIDDSYEKLIAAYQCLDADIAEVLREALTLVAFRASAPPVQCYGLRCHVLPSWQHIDQLIEYIVPPSEQKETHRGYNDPKEDTDIEIATSR